MKKYSQAQAAVYAAEEVLNSVTRQFKDFDEAVAYLNRVMDSVEFEARWPDARVNGIEYNGRVRAVSGSTCVVEKNIGLGKYGLNAVTVLHELAHLLSPKGHGLEWRANFLELVRIEMGLYAYAALRKEYREAGL